VENLEKRALLTAISSGQTIAATIAHPGEIDTYTFSVAAGHSFVVSAGAAVGGPAAPVIQVFAPDSTRVIDTGYNGSSQTGTYTVPAGKGGTYSMLVSDYFSGGTGAYSAEVVIGPGTLAAGGDGKAVVSGQTIAAAIDHPGDIDGYTFSASSGQSFVVSAGAAAGSSSAPVFQVFGPDGARVLNTGYNGASQTGTYTVPAGKSGTYTAVVADYFSGGNGKYSFELIKGPDTLAATGDGKAIVSGQSIPAKIDHPGDIDGYTFSASAGDTFVVSAGAAVNSPVAPVIQVFAPDGARVVSTGYNGSSQTATYKIPSGKSGTYTIVVSDYFSGASGAYFAQLSGNLHPVTPTLTVTPPAAQTASVNVSKSFTLGSLTVKNATSPYTVDINWGDGTANTKFTVTAGGTIPAKTHTYAKTGTFTASILVTDAKAHASNKPTFKVTVGTAPTASIAGTVFNDANTNGKMDTTELGLGLWQVYLDINRNGRFDTGDKLATTAVDGAWSFSGLTAGSYVVRIVQRTGTATTTPAGGVYTITLAAAQKVTGKLFGEKRV
jgi:uncharacterized protein (DUF2141 family)